MPEQITPLSTLYFLLHGAGTAISVVLCLYLLLCRGTSYYEYIHNQRMHKNVTDWMREEVFLQKSY